MNFDRNHRFIGIDFEYDVRPGEPPIPICMVAKDFTRGGCHEVFFENGAPEPPCPLELDASTILVAHNLSAEIACFDVLGWPMPERGLCTFAEYRRFTNGSGRRARLLDACSHFRIPFVEDTYKVEMQGLALRGGPYTRLERKALMQYCATDVLALEPLLRRLSPFGSGWEIRGRFMLEVGRMQNRGIPVDAEGIERWQNERPALRLEITEVVNRRYGVPLYEDGRFRKRSFEDMVVRRGYVWPRLESGRLNLRDETIKSMASLHPELNFFRQANRTLKQSTDRVLPVGRDGRHRYDFLPFVSGTGRSQPKGDCIFLGPSWMRGFVQAPPGKVLVIADFTSQEILIGAACAEDHSMMADYFSGDFYLGFAKRAGAIASNAQRGESPEVDAARALFKQLALAVQYGMGFRGLAKRLGQSESRAKQLLKGHRRAYPDFWRWRERIGNAVAMNKPLKAALGWRLLPPYASKSSIAQGKDSTLSSLNFPVQATGSEILRATVIRLAAEGFEICATVHDSVVVELPLDGWKELKDRLEFVMTEATRPLLNGHGVLVDSKVLLPGERYVDDRGREMFELMGGRLGLDT